MKVEKMTEKGLFCGLVVEEPQNIEAKVEDTEPEVKETPKPRARKPRKQ